MPFDLRRRTLLAASAALPFLPLRARAQGVVKVGSTPTGIPFTFLDTKTNTLTGFMVDLAAAVAKNAGFAMDVQPTPFAALIPSLTTSRIDLISAAMFDTAVRREQVDFSDPIYGYGEGVAVKDGETPNWTGIADLKGVAVGAQIGTAFVDPLHAAGADVRTYETGQDIVRDLVLGRIKAAVVDAPILSYNIAEGTFRGIKLVSGYKPSVLGKVAMATRKGDTLLARVNEGLAKAKSEGTVSGLLAKWKLPPSVGV